MEFTALMVYSCVGGVGDERVKLVDTGASEENTILTSANTLKMG
jgi:hypothetical protein